MRALKSHQIQWIVTVTRKYNPPREIRVFGRSKEEALLGVVSSAREVWGIWDAKSFGVPVKQ
jgi:hypothetical protein